MQNEQRKELPKNERAVVPHRGRIHEGSSRDG
jgi:hypothetical protein